MTSVADLPKGKPILLGQTFPDFHCETTHGNFSFHQFLKSDPNRPWTIFFGHPDDFTPVCTTELARAEELANSDEAEFSKRGVKLIGISCNSVESHIKWSVDIQSLAAQSKYNTKYATIHHENSGQVLNQQTPAHGLTHASSSISSSDSGHSKTMYLPDKLLSYPMITDPDRKIVASLGMLDPNQVGKTGLPLPARYLSIIGPDLTLKLSILYPASTGRNFDEVLRVIDSLQLTLKHKLATPVDWRVSGDNRCVVVPAVPTETAMQQYPELEIKTMPSGKQYLRYVNEPEHIIRH